MSVRWGCYMFSLLMDEQVIHLLLKEQPDALHAELYVQIAALTIELQAAKLVVQSQHGGGFLDRVRNYFGPCKYEDPQGVLSKLLQTGTITQYQSEVKKLMNRVIGISKNLLISFYISGLKSTLQRELLVLKTSLGDAFSLARVTAARLED
ncbi:hypothetical protein Tco_0403986 [Tanacetum coccineum]|uniref:Uncharacterized protein n=1 Tax=Tanacetum coccineum TaxID=301880 RepID=A0ABQ5B3W6_9ASTR